VAGGRDRIGLTGQLGRRPVPPLEQAAGLSVESVEPGSFAWNGVVLSGPLEVAHRLRAIWDHGPLLAVMTAP